MEACRDCLLWCYLHDLFPCSLVHVLLAATVLQHRGELESLGGEFLPNHHLSRTHGDRFEAGVFGGLGVQEGTDAEVNVDVVGAGRSDFHDICVGNDAARDLNKLCPFLSAGFACPIC